MEIEINQHKAVNKDKGYVISIYLWSDDREIIGHETFWSKSELEPWNTSLKHSVPIKIVDR